MVHHQKTECPVKKNWLMHSGSRSQWWVKMLMFVQKISSKPPNIVFPNLVLWWIMSQSVMQKDWFDIYKVKVTARAHMIKTWQFLHIFRTADSFATKLGFIVHYHKPECFTEILDCYVQNVNECLSTWYLLNCWTVYHQPRCVDASLWARLSFKKIGLLSLRSKS